MFKTAPSNIALSGLLLLLQLVSLTAQAEPDTRSPLQDRIRQQVELLRKGSGLTVHGEQIASVIVLPALYERRDFQPVWTNPAARDQMLNIIAGIDEDGLNGDDYNLRTLQAVLAERTGSQDPETWADTDLLLTDSLVRLGYHLRAGKVDPEDLDANWNMTYTLGDLDSILAMSSAIESAELPQLIEMLRPQHPMYENLRQALARYHAIEASGGWPAVPPGPVLKPGMDDPRVQYIRQRLLATGELQETLPSAHFDSALEVAVKAFQSRHGLTADGIVGPGTLAAMNVTAAARIDQIRVNLDRARWVLHDLPDTFVLTDIAGFRVTLFRNGERVWSTRAQVGKPYRRTPVFRDTIRYLEVNPTWTVPPTILKKDILPKIRKDPGYLDQKDMQVLTFSGEPVDPATIDWQQYIDRPLPYLIRQRPGPRNALGRVKFMFPNKHAVYLHDTPSRSLFDRDARAFSSGCIRVQDPFVFGELLLNQPEWSRQRLLDVVESRKTTRINLQNPVTVLLLYWTVDTDDRGQVIFRPDIYNRDPAILRALNSPFSFRRSPILDS